MSKGEELLEAIKPQWRALIPAGDRDYFDSFVVRKRAALIVLLDQWLAKRSATKGDQAPPIKASGRTRRNIEAMRIVATRRPEDMTAEERQTVLGYTGWGGLSIEGVADQFPPDFAPDEFALVHEYYTPSVVADAIADQICPRLPQLAGRDGVVRAFEPSVGIGRLVRPLGPPRCLITTPPYRETRWLAVELSAVSARMFHAMRPDVNLYTGSLESWMSEHAAEFQSTISLVVSNPPYGERGEYANHDKTAEYQETKSYIYFLRRCLDLLVPQGLGVFVIPAGFLSGTSHRKQREKVLRRHHLEVAFRLPSENSAGVALFPGARNVVDVIFWTARGGELAAVDPADQDILDGRYFEENPGHVLGVEHDKVRDKTDPGKKFDRYRVVGDFLGFPKYTARPICVSCQIRAMPQLTSQPVVTVTRDMGEDAEDTDIQRALSLGRRVDKYFALVGAEDERAVGQWRELVDALEAFRSIGPIAAKGGNPWMWLELRTLANRRSLAGGLLRAYQKSGELAPGLASPPKIRPKFSAPAQDVLAQAEYLFRTRRRLTTPELVEFHRAQGGTLTTAAMVATLTSNGWNIDGDEWDVLMPARAYLNGVLWPKLDRALARADAGDTQAQAQARKLEAVMGLAVFEDIQGVSPRQGWVPLTLVSEWLAMSLNKRYGAVELVRSGGTVQPAQSMYEKIGEAPGVTPETLWFIGWLNHDFTIFKPDLSPGRIAELKEEEERVTGVAVAQEEKKGKEDGDGEEEDEDLGLVRLLLGSHWDREFAAWVASDAELREEITTAYNRSFRGVVIPTYDNEVLAISRWTETGPQLKPHQIAGALRILDLLGGLIAFDVGVGKTYTAIAIIAAAREAGTVRRPVVLVPSSLVWKWHDDFLCVLADYRVLVIGSNRKRISRGKRVGLLTSVTDTPDERAAKWSEFQAGLWDVVVLSYDALARTKMNMEALLAYVATIEGIQREIKLRKRNAAKKKPDKMSERDRAILKHGVRAFVEEMLELPPGHKFDPGIAWDDLGIDMLVVDEAASFKNSYKPEPREHGLPKFMGSSGDGSKRAWQLDFRAAAVRRNTGGSGIVLLTATPAKNSPLEFYNLIQLVDPYAFAAKGLMDPEQFIDRFIRIQSREVIDMTLRVKMESVVDGFRNLDDLRVILQTYGEFRSAEGVGLVLPDARSEQVRVRMNADQEEQYAEIVRKLERALKRSAMGESSQNAILGLMARLSVIAMHPRLDGGVEYRDALSIPPADYAAPKLSACAERVVASAGCGHIIFVEQTAVHLWMREVLVQLRVPRERIAILNAEETAPADRLRIARDFNGVESEPPAPGSCAGPTSRRVPPKYDVIIANSVAYEGVDLQVRTCAIHHLDLPWTPADLEQRNGRAVRQGNSLPVVQIFYYLSDRSLDWYRYQLIQGKRGWLSTVLEGQARDTSNPGAQTPMTNEEMLLMISRDPERTARAFAERREAIAAEARAKVAREAANLAAQAAARFRDARATSDVERAARLRVEGEERLRDLNRIDVTSWPWARLMANARELDVLVVSSADPPVFEGLRYGKHKVPNRTFGEFGRVIGATIGHRSAGGVSWQLFAEQQVRALHLSPAELEVSDWPEEDLTEALAQHVRSSLEGSLATIAELDWQGASDVWLTRWWPSVAPIVRSRLVASEREEKYPCVQGGVLRLESGPGIVGELLPPTIEGWALYQKLAVSAKALKYGELHKVGLLWWQRAFPRGLRATETNASSAAEDAPPPEEGALEWSAEMQELLRRDKRDAESTDPPEVVDQRVADNLALQFAATHDALGMAGASKADREKLVQASIQILERMTILRGVAAVLRGRGYQVALAGPPANAFTVIGENGQFLAAAPHVGAVRIAPGLARDVQARVTSDVADARRIVQDIILDEVRVGGPRINEKMMLSVWRRVRASAPAQPSPDAARPRAGAEAARAIARRLQKLLTGSVRVDRHRYGSADSEAVGDQVVVRFYGDGPQMVLYVAPRQDREVDLRGELLDEDGGTVRRFDWIVIQLSELIALSEVSFAKWFGVPVEPEQKLSVIMMEALAALKAEEDAQPWEPHSWPGVHDSTKDALIARGLAVALDGKSGGFPRYKTTSAGRAALLRQATPAEPVAVPDVVQKKARGSTPKPQPRPDTWGERLERRFNGLPGTHESRFEGPAGPNGVLLEIRRDDRVVAAASITEDDIELRWLAELRASEQRAIEARIERAVADENRAQAVAENEEAPEFGPIRDLLKSLRSTAASAGAGMRDHPVDDPLHRLALAVRELADDRVVSPHDLATWVADQGEWALAEAIRDPDPSKTPDQIMEAIWDVADEAMPVSKVTREGERIRVDRFAISEDNWVLVRERAKDTRYALHRVQLEVVGCEGAFCEVKSKTRLKAKAETISLAPGAAKIEAIYERLDDYERTIRRAPELLSDVRHILFLTGLLVDTAKCQGAEQRAAARAFEQANGYYDQAARQLVRGKSAAAAEQMHAALRRVAIAAAEIAESCAAGQVSMVPSRLAVSPRDTEILESEQSDVVQE